VVSFYCGISTNTLLCGGCAVEFCLVNVTSSDLSLLADTDYLTVRCEVYYLAASHWIPQVQCLPNILGQTELTDISGGIIYTKWFNATPDINGVVINCTAKFNSTGYEPRQKQTDNEPDDVQLWNSALLHVQCKRFLSARLARIFPNGQPLRQDRLSQEHNQGTRAGLGQMVLMWNL